MLAKNPFAEAWAMLDDVARYEAKIAELDARRGPITCDAGEEPRADWYFVRVKPGQDLRAMKKLADRKFGVYRPMRQRQDRNGKPLQGRVPMFPGWLFVVPWNIEISRSRILNCPGVAEMFCYPNSDRPVVISDDFIMTMRAEAESYDENAPETADGPRQGKRAEVTGLRQEKRIFRLKKRHRKELKRLKTRAKELGVFDQSTWEKLNALEPGDRIALFKRTLMSTALAGCPAQAGL